MSLEPCQICKKDSTPWVHINGHICEDCAKPDKWIHVNDRMPEPNEKVLIYDTPWETVETAFYCPNNVYKYIWFYPDNNGWKEHEINFWMPLPELPNEC